MKEKAKAASGGRASIPEVAITLQEDSSIRGEIKVSIQEEVIRKLDSILPDCPPEAQAVIREVIVEISDLKERESTRSQDDVEALNTVIEALRIVQPGRETARFFRDTEKSILTSSPEDRPFVINARIKAAAAMMRQGCQSPPATEGADPLRYDTRTLNQRRGEALATHALKTGKAAIKSTEAGTVLETIEGRKLDRKTIHRALDVARGILRASSEVVGGVRRLVIPSSPEGGGEDHPQPVVGGGGDRGGVSRPRRWTVPWDGVD